MRGALSRRCTTWPPDFCPRAQCIPGSAACILRLLRRPVRPGSGPRRPEPLLRPICSVHPSARSESEHENQQPGRFRRRLARRCAAPPRLAEAAVPRPRGSGRRGRFRRQRRRPGYAGSAGGHADQRVPAQRCGHGYAQPAGSVELGAAAGRVRDQIHGQQRSRGLRGLARRATLRGTWLHHADRPAHLQPLAGPRLCPPGERPPGHRPLGSGPADLLLPLLRADAARRRDRHPGRPRHLSARQRLHHGLLGTGQGRDRAGADRAAGIRPGRLARRPSAATSRASLPLRPPRTTPLTLPR